MPGKYQHKETIGGKSYLDYLAEDLSKQKGVPVSKKQAEEYNRKYIQGQSIYGIISELSKKKT